MKKHLRTVFCAAALSLAVSPFSPFVWAAEAPPAVRKIGLVNLDKVFREYKGTKSTEARLEDLSKSKGTQRQQMVSEIRKLRDELPLLNDESRSAQQKTLEEKMKGLAAFDQSARDGLMGERNAAMRLILQEIEGTVNVFAKEKGFDLILSDRAVLYGVAALDITDEIVARINAGDGKRRP